MITRDDAPNCKLSSLARVFRSTTTPNHRALSDARATVDVLHGLMERLGGLGVHTLEELQTFSARVSTAQRRKRHLAEGLPHSPGVYLFRDDAPPGPLRRHLARPAHPRALLLHRLRDPLADGRDGRARRRPSTGIECATALEAQVRELRLIAEHKPRYNRRSRFPEQVHFLKLTREPWPRLSLVRRVLDDDADYLGPFAVTQGRREVPGRAPRHLPGAPVHRAARHGAVARAVRAGRDGPLPLAVRRQRRRHDVRRGGAAAARHAPAPARRGGRAINRADGRRSPPTSGSRRPASTATGWRRSSGPPPAPSGSPPSPAAPRSWPPAARTDGRWAVHVVRHGRLAAAGVIPPGADAHQFVAELRPRAETVGDAPGPGAGRDRRGDRAGAALAGVRRASGSSRSTASGPARSPAPPATSRSTTRSTESRRLAGAVRRPPRPRDRAPARPASGLPIVRVA